MVAANGRPGDRTRDPCFGPNLLHHRNMSPVDERALWLARCILPHEPEIRAWLRTRRPPGLEIDDIIQETYARLSAIEDVGHIRDARTYAFQTARSVALS